MYLIRCSQGKTESALCLVHGGGKEDPVPDRVDESSLVTAEIDVGETNKEGEVL